MDIRIRIGLVFAILFFIIIEFIIFKMRFASSFWEFIGVNIFNIIISCILSFFIYMAHNDFGFAYENIIKTIIIAPALFMMFKLVLWKLYKIFNGWDD